MNLKSLFSLAVIMSCFTFFRIGSSISTHCKETTILITKAREAKVKYEEAEYFHTKESSVYKSRYSALVKAFKQKDKIEARKECLREMISKDSIDRAGGRVIFTYLPLISSTVTKCNEMSNAEFLWTMLINLDEHDNDSTLVCDAEGIKRGEQQRPDVDSVKRSIHD